MGKILYLRSFILYVDIVPIDWLGCPRKHSRLVDIYGQFCSLVTAVTIELQKLTSANNGPSLFVATSRCCFAHFARSLS